MSKLENKIRALDAASGNKHILEDLSKCKYELNNIINKKLNFKHKYFGKF